MPCRARTTSPHSSSRPATFPAGPVRWGEGGRGHRSGSGPRSPRAGGSICDRQWLSRLREYDMLSARPKWPGIKTKTVGVIRCPPIRAVRRGNQSREGATEMIRIVLTIAVLTFGATVLLAQTDPIAARRALMKANGDQSKVATEMLEAKRPFNLDEAKKVFASFAEAG